MKCTINLMEFQSFDEGTTSQLIRQSINLALEYLIHKSFQ
jgi:hypothetical protein